MAAALRGEPQLKLQLAIGGGRLWNRLHCCWSWMPLPFSCALSFLNRIFTAARRHSSCVPPTNNITRSPSTAPTGGSSDQKAMWEPNMLRKGTRETPYLQASSRLSWADVHPVLIVHSRFLVVV